MVNARRHQPQIAPGGQRGTGRARARNDDRPRSAGKRIVIGEEIKVTQRCGVDPRCSQGQVAGHIDTAVAADVAGRGHGRGADALEDEIAGIDVRGPHRKGSGSRGWGNENLRRTTCAEQTKERLVGIGRIAGSLVGLADSD